MAGKSRTAARRENSVAVVPQRTLVIALPLTSEQFDLLATVADSYARVWSSLIAWCKNNKSVNRTVIHRENYARLRERFPSLPAQFICAAIRDAAGAMKSWNSNHPRKKWQLRASKHSLTLNYDLRLMSLRGSLLSLSTMLDSGRIRVMLPDIPAWFDSRYPKRKLNAAKVILDSKTRTAKIALIYRLPETATLAEGDVVGVDLGIYNLYTSSGGGEYSSSKVRAVKRRYAHNRRTLQAKGTRSARRRLRELSGREKRFIRDVNHQASKQIVAIPATVIAFEDLAYIRNQAKRNTKGGRRRRNMLHQWSFSQLQEFASYKAAALGKQVVFIDPKYTSQKCSRCGFVDARSRDKSRFDCLRCGYSCHADFNAAVNIADRAKHTLSNRIESRALSTARMDGVPRLPATAEAWG